MTIISEETENREKLGVYIHVPFCKHKCGYCDFLSFENESAVLHKVYAKAVIKEIEAWSYVCGDDLSVDTIFIGGGTPSLLLPGTICDMVDAVKDYFSVDSDAEITIEANPGTLSASKLEGYLNAGINRLSIGAQSFHDFVLKILGRIHIADDIYKSIDAARSAGFDNINLDLMFGIPEQTMEIWQDTVRKTIELAPSHISFYSLQIEKGTKFYDLFEIGPYEKISDELDRQMYHFALNEFKNAGYGHYEISNAAKNGFECRHNLKYWAMKPYIGAGLGAHSYVGGTRTGNIEDIEDYIDINLEDPQGLTNLAELAESRHENNVNDEISEYMFTGLRRISGIDTADFERRFKRSFQDVFANEWQKIKRYMSDGLVAMDGSRLMLTEKGMDVSNKIMSVFILINKYSK